MTDEKQSGRAVLLVVAILALSALAWALASRISMDAQDVPGAQARR